MILLSLLHQYGWSQILRGRPSDPLGWTRAELIAELKQIRAQRDYYRRRWLIHGIHFPTWLWKRELYVAEAMKRLTLAREEDGDD